MVGNEAMGLTKFLLDISDKLVKIPMVGEASSFNASCAGSIFMYEIFTQRKN
jgi:TrmH family RNA methyltransferase